MQQSKLTSLFKRIAADEVITQRQELADIFQREHPLPVAAAAAAARVPKSGPGRPRKKRELELEQAEVLLPYAERCITTHELPSDAKIVLVLDVWAVHKLAPTCSTAKPSP